MAEVELALRRYKRLLRNRGRDEGDVRQSLRAICGIFRQSSDPAPLVEMIMEAVNRG